MSPSATVWLIDVFLIAFGQRKKIDQALETLIGRIHFLIDIIDNKKNIEYTEYYSISLFV